MRGHSDQEPLGPHHHHLARWQQPLGSLWEQPFTIPAPCSRPPGPPAPASLLPAPCRRLQLCVPAELCMQPSMRGQLITCDYFAKIRLVVGSCVEDMKLKASSSGLGWAGLLLPPASAALCCPRPLCCQRCCQPRRCCCCGGGCPLLPGWRAALCCRAQPASTAAPFPPAGAAGAIYRDCPAAAGHTWAGLNEHAPPPRGQLEPAAVGEVHPIHGTHLEIEAIELVVEHIPAGGTGRRVG